MVWRQATPIFGAAAPVTHAAPTWRSPTQEGWRNGGPPTGRRHRAEREAGEGAGRATVLAEPVDLVDPTLQRCRH